MITPYYGNYGRLAYTTTDAKGKGTLTWNGSSGPRYDSIDWVVTSPNGAHLCYGASLDGKYFTVIDGQEGPRYANVGMIHYSPDGKHLAHWLYPDDKTARMEIDGQAGPVYDSSAEEPAFSSDSRHIAYLATKGSHQVVVEDGVEGQAYDGIAFSTYANDPMLSFSPDGSRLAYVARQGDDCFAVVAGVAQQHFRVLRGIPCFSADGKHIAYFARPLTENARQWLLVVDDHPVAAYDHVSPAPMRLANGHLAFVAVAQGHLWHVDLDLADNTRIAAMPVVTGDAPGTAVADPAESVEELPLELYILGVTEKSYTLNDDGGFATLDGSVDHLLIGLRDVALAGHALKLKDGRAVFATVNFGELQFAPGSGPGMSLLATPSQLDDILLEGSPLSFTK